jgi:hypothetical protein
MKLKICMDVLQFQANIRRMMKSFENFEIVLENIRKKGLKMGLNFVDDDFRILNRKVIGIIIPNMIVIIISNIYSLNIYADDMEKTVFCLVTCGFVIKAAIKLNNYIINREKFKKILKKIKKFHVIAASNECEEIFLKNSRICDLVTRFEGFLFGSVAL